MRALDSQVTVCMATFKRNERLRAVLDDLARQDRLPNRIVVVDNDPAGAARPVVEDFRASGVPFHVDYDVQPVPNISITRNRSVELASGDWIAFIDDDERAPPEWLRELLSAVERYQADGVLAPVEPQVPTDAPRWIRRGRFYDFAHQPEGAEVPLNCMRFGNVLLRADLLRGEAVPFDPRYGLTSGEDTDLLVRLVHKGARIVWTERAPVSEPVEPKRLSLRFLATRALAGGQAFARYMLEGGYGPVGPVGRVLFFLKSLVQLLAAAVFTLGSLPLGRHRAAAWLTRVCANFGKLSVFWGWRYNPYGRRA
ncbi:MAG: succinoglycan biosynthesis protein ExoM [Gammaproteobacteria bacterium]|jgi:succinoglycan biosynthesis protein ExoM|nr:succinoglycan biosynthesis protein ExoM [Gammaproteobacteria bacterium]